MARILKEVFVFHLQNRWNALTLENKIDHVHNSETRANEKELKYDVMWDANLPLRQIDSVCVPLSFRHLSPRVADHVIGDKMWLRVV